MRKVFVAMMVLAIYWVIFPPDPWQMSVPFMLRADAQSPPTVSPPCGTPAWTASPGAPVNAQNLNAEIYHLEACAGNAAAFPSSSPPIVATGSPPVFTIVTGNCLSITSGVLNYTCPTPAQLVAGPCTSPYATQSPDATQPTGIAIGIVCGAGGSGIIAGTCIATTPTANPTGAVIVSVSGAGCTSPPLPLSVANGGTSTSQPSPTVTTTAGSPSYSGTWPSQLLSVPVGFQAPTPSATGVLCVSAGAGGVSCPTNTPLDQVQLNDGASHQYKLNDTGAFSHNCPATWADTGNTGGNPLTTPAAAPSGLICGAQSSTSDGEASVEWRTNASTDYIVVPSAAEPTSSPASTSFWTIEVVLMPNMTATSANQQFAFEQDNSNHFSINCINVGTTSNIGSNANGANQSYGPAGAQPGWGSGSCVSGRPFLLDITYNNSVATAYVNGLWIGILTAYTIVNPGSNGTLGDGLSGSTFPWLGRISKLAFYPSVLSDATIQAHYFAMRCGALIAVSCGLP